MHVSVSVGFTCVIVSRLARVNELLTLMLVTSLIYAE